MAHTYILVSATNQGADTVIKATVDGFAVQVDVPTAQITSQPSVLALQNFLAPILLGAALQAGDFPVSNAQALTAGTFTQ